MSGYVAGVGAATSFSPERATKADIFRGEHLFVGLNCFEPGQGQRIHAHQDADKVYLVVSGKARLTVGHETREAVAGDIVWAPAEVPHGVEQALERTVMVVVMSEGRRGEGR